MTIISPSPCIKIPLVGMHFRPPAKAILGGLPTGATLVLSPEPENPYDPKAIKVLVSLRDNLPVSKYMEVDHECEGSGHYLAELLEAEPHSGPFHLGYLADSDGKMAQGGPGNREAGVILAQGPYSATLAFTGDGKSLVALRARETE